MFVLLLCCCCCLLCCCVVVLLLSLLTIRRLIEDGRVVIDILNIYSNINWDTPPRCQVIGTGVNCHNRESGDFNSLIVDTTTEETNNN